MQSIIGGRLMRPGCLAAPDLSAVLLDSMAKRVWERA